MKMITYEFNANLVYGMIFFLIHPISCAYRISLFRQALPIEQENILGSLALTMSIFSFALGSIFILQVSKFSTWDPPVLIIYLLVVRLIIKKGPAFCDKCFFKKEDEEE